MDVAIAAMLRVSEESHHEVLITQRSLQKDYGGYWEFPGGKIEQDEDPGIALDRELLEELGIFVQKKHYVGEFSYKTPITTIHLFLFIISQFVGSPQRQESQLTMRWVNINELNHYCFPEANASVIEWLIHQSISILFPHNCLSHW